MKEVAGEYTCQRLGATFFQGSKPINAVWATENVKIERTCVIPTGYGICNAMLFDIDIHAESILGNSQRWIMQPQAQRLNCQIPGIVEKYNKFFENLIDKHSLLEKIGMAYEATTPDKTT